MRVTNSMAYNSLLDELSKNMENYRTVNASISTGKKLLNPSDDPTGMALSNSFNAQEAAYSKYLENISQAEEFLTATDSSLQEISNVIAKAREIAELGATGTSDNMSREISANQVQDLIDQSIELANTKVRGRYIFSGFKTSEPAYLSTGKILTPEENSSNTYDQNVTSSGVFTGSSEKSYLIKISTAGAVGVAKYQVSEDDGATWGTAQTLNSSIDVFDNANGTDLGVNLNFANGNFAVDDTFKVDVVRGFYNGDNGSIEYNINQNSRVKTNITGQEVFEDNDYFETLYKLKNGLSNNNITDISAALEDLNSIKTNIEPTLVKAGSNLNKLEITKNNLFSLKENIMASINNIEDVDMFTALSDFAKQENTLQATVGAMGKVLPASLINYI